ncbi:MAG TPA: WcaF family extracellular polysaccharide biosynthesis acetyltransferase [Ferruginibacter sp.]|nr:WcaF family extracellular polysaccharide biosynthesis acetyltransferase [Ferruginibacter sp.]
MPVQLNTYNNNWYKPGNVFKRVLWYFINMIFFKNGFFPFYSLKRGLLRLFGAKVGSGVLIKPFVNIKYPWFLEMGNDIWIGEKVWIDNLGKVVIGNNVCISQGALLLSGNHDYTKTGFDLIIKPIRIDEGVWIGANAVVCAGATCNSHSVLTVGSVTAGELDAYGIYQGNPAVKIKERKYNA